MASPQQIAANRANARLSTGPVTESGKRIASRNSYRHGLTGQVVIRTPEEHAAYVRFSDTLMPDLAPATALECVIADRIVSDSWRLQRAAAIERAMFDLVETGHDPGDASSDAETDDILHFAAAFAAKDKSFNLMSLYMSRIQRSVHKDIEMLRSLQFQRLATQEIARRAAQDDARRAAQDKTRRAAQNPAPSPRRSPGPSPAVGSVYSAPPRHHAPPPAAPFATPENMAA